jgi:hypothetical protein
VRRSRQKEPMFKLRGQVAYGTSYVRINRVTLTARRGSVMGFIQNEKTASAERSKPIVQRRRIGFIDEKTMWPIRERLLH